MTDGSASAERAQRTRLPADPDALPTDRYGHVLSPAERRRRVRLTAVVAAALGLLALVWVGSSLFAVQVRTQDTGFVVVDEQTVEVSFLVSKPPASRVQCRVRALSPSFAEVGVRDVQVGPSADDTVAVTTRLATSEPATTGLVQRCRLLER